MNSTIQPKQRKWDIARDKCEVTPDRGLDMLLALDQMVVEVSMQLYGVKRRDRSSIRHSNRRLHSSVRKHLPRLLS